MENRFDGDGRPAMTPHAYPAPHQFPYGYRPGANSHASGLGVASVLVGALALFTSWLLVGICFGLVAVALGFTALARATPGVRMPLTGAIGIALGVVAMVVGVGFLVVLWPDLQQVVNGDPCRPVKQHAACY